MLFKTEMRCFDIVIARRKLIVAWSSQVHGSGLDMASLISSPHFSIEDFVTWQKGNFGQCARDKKVKTKAALCQRRLISDSDYFSQADAIDYIVHIGPSNAYLGWLLDVARPARCATDTPDFYLS